MGRSRERGNHRLTFAVLAAGVAACPSAGEAVAATE